MNIYNSNFKKCCYCFARTESVRLYYCVYTTQSFHWIDEKRIMLDKKCFFKCKQSSLNEETFHTLSQREGIRSKSCYIYSILFN